MYYISWSLFMVRLLLQMRAMSLSVFYCQRIIWWNSYFVTNTDRTIYWLSFVICVSDKNSVIGFYLGVLLLTLFFILVAFVVIKSVWCETRMCSVFIHCVSFAKVSRRHPFAIHNLANGGVFPGDGYIRQAGTLAAAGVRGVTRLAGLRAARRSTLSITNNRK